MGTLHLAVLLLSALQPDALALFDAHSFHWARTGKSYRYRLYDPAPERETTKRYPLIVWLHGYNENGDDNIGQLEWLDRTIIDAPRSRERFPFYLLAVQCPKEQSMWFEQSRAVGKLPDDMLEATYAIVQSLLAEKPIDHDRVFVAGLSFGGTACWEFAVRHPDLFAAVLPLASAGFNSHPSFVAKQYLERVNRIPIWAFHSNNDGKSPISLLRGTVQALTQIGGNVRLTEVESTEHDCWTVAFRDHHAIDWLLAQRRGRAGRAGRIPISRQIVQSAAAWNWWQLALEAAVICVPAIFLWQLVASSQLRWSLRIETVLAISVLALLLQIFPGIYGAVFSAIDVRNWSWKSYAVASSVAISLLVGVKALQEK